MSARAVSAISIVQPKFSRSLGEVVGPLALFQRFFRVMVVLKVFKVPLDGLGGVIALAASGLGSQGIQTLVQSPRNPHNARTSRHAYLLHYPTCPWRDGTRVTPVTDFAKAVCTARLLGARSSL